MARTLLIITALALMPALAACKKADDTAPQVKRPAVQKQAVAERPAEDAAKAGAEADLKLRNPFQSHLVLMKGSDKARKIKGPLECCELSVFKLVAVVVGISDDDGFGLVQAQDGKRYVIRRGDVLGTREGKVVRMSPGGVVVREVTRDEDGKVRSSEDVELRVVEKQK